MNDIDIKINGRVTIKHIAKAAGVSVSTVSRAIRNDPRANSKTIKRILEIAKKLNYYPDSLAKSLRQKKTYSVGIIVNDLTNPFYTAVIDEIVETLYQKNYTTYISYSKWDYHRERKIIDTMLSRRVDGIIISPVNDTSDNLKLLSSHGIDTVVIDCYSKMKDISHVFTDHEKGAEIATEYLIKNGHKDILLITGPVHAYIEEIFERGYKRTLNKHNIRFNNNYIVRCNEITVQSGYETFKKLLTESSEKTHLHFSAIITICDLLAYGIYKVSNELGFNIPNNYSIVGYDNFEMSSVLSPPLTTINQPRDVIGKESIKILLENIHSDKKEHKKAVFKPNLLIRGSVRKLN
jgi:LacI family transcriptional regulator